MADNKQLSRLNEMKSIVNKLGLNSVVVPFLPSYTATTEVTLTRTDVDTTNKDYGKEICHTRCNKSSSIKGKTSAKTLSPVKSIRKSQRIGNKRKTLKPTRLFKETPGHLTKSDALFLKTVLRENREPNVIFDKYISTPTLYSPNKTVSSTKEPSRQQIIEKEELNKTLSPQKEQFQIQILEKDIMDKTLPSEKILDDSKKIQILNSTILTGKSAVPMKNLSEVKDKAKTSMSDIDVPNSPSKSRVNIIVNIFVTQIIKHVAGHKCLQKLLCKREINILNEFLKLSRKEYVFFCLRLFTRKVKWYNVFKLKNRLKLEMCDREVMDMYRCLSELGFVDIDYSSEPIESLLNGMLVGDIKKMCLKFKLCSNSRSTKDIMIGKLLVFINRQTTLTSSKTSKDIVLNDIQQSLGPCVKINTELCKVLHKIHLLYKFVSFDFENVHDLYQFMEQIKDGTIIMPQITINENYEVFSSISSFDSFQPAYELREEIRSAIRKNLTYEIFKLCSLAYDELKKIIKSSVPDNRPPCIVRFTPGHQYASALSSGLKHLTKHYPTEVNEWLQFLLQQHMYCRKLVGSWYNTLITVQSFHLKQKGMANDTLIKALQETTSIIDLTDLNVKAEQIKHSKTYKITQSLFGQISALQPILIKDFPFVEIDSKAIKSEIPGRKRDYFVKSESGLEYMPVEEVALRYYFKNGFANGLHCEGALVVSLFFILFWDIIYGNAVPYAFISEIQYYPLDLHTKEFYTNRETEINRRLSEIESEWSTETLNKFVCDIWEKHSHEKSYIYSNIVNQPKDLEGIILCIGRVKLSKIMQRLVLDFRIYQSGLPDLFLWNTSNKKCKFVEVKGEGDILSSGQKCWLDFLRSIDLDIEVCHVHTIGSKRRRRVKNVKTKKKEKDDIPKKKSKSN
ncbi:hypothetical protein FQR65_LT04329 [Abscondita terminalis]|nr:hypothetical protein FQR65_LT04329 [Abscondita terminalis]